MNNRLYVGNLPYSMDAEGLASIFTQLGFAVERPQVILDRDSGRSKGFGFIEIASPGKIEDAIQQTDGLMVDGRTINVSIARLRTSDSGSSSRSGGGRTPSVHFEEEDDRKGHRKGHNPDRHGFVRGGRG
jgi:RNA recognition motif-containing protein